MNVTAPAGPCYTDALVRLYHGDTLRVLAAHGEAIWPVQTVLTAPPWFWFRASQALVDGRQPWTVKAEAEWLAGALDYTVQWWAAAARLINDASGRLWVVTHVSYLGAYARCALLMGWPTPQVWTTSGSPVAVLQAGARVPLDVYVGVLRRLEAAVNPIEDMALLEYIALVSGGPVLDPFCGTGRTLVSASRVGLRSVGIDKDWAQIAAAMACLRSARRGRPARAV